MLFYTWFFFLQNLSTAKLPSNDHRPDRDVISSSFTKSITEFPHITSLQWSQARVDFSVNVSQANVVIPAAQTSEDFDHTTEVTRLRFQARLERLKDVCQKLNSSLVRRLDMRSASSMYVAHDKLDWCSVPKVGSTYLNGFFKDVFHLPESPYQASFHSGKPSERKTCCRLQQLLTTPGGIASAKCQQQFQNCPKHFMFVREPYSRLYSGYLGKIHTNPEYWEKYGVYIKNLNRKRFMRRCGHNVSFPEFVKYFIHAEKTKRKRNIHFQPLMSLCGACRRRFDFIGHLETISEDVKFMLSSVGAPQVLVQ